jgi:hypothetical protein
LQCEDSNFHLKRPNFIHEVRLDAPIGASWRAFVKAAWSWLDGRCVGDAPSISGNGKEVRVRAKQGSEKSNKKTMKAMNKIITRLTVGCVFACYLLLNISSFAIEGLKVSVQGTNAVLSWPSATNETYVAQYRSNLNATSSWVTLTNYLSAATASNLTFFIHSNSVTYPPILVGGGTNGGGSINPTGTNSDSGGGTNTFATTAGFYRVVRDGAHIYGLTNNSTLSGEVQMPIEFAVDSTDNVESVTFFNSADDSPVIGASADTNSAGRWIFDWDTSMVENGNYNIYAEVDFTIDDPVSSTDLPVSLNVSNLVSFPNYFSRIFGSQMWIYAETIPDAAYQIDMYDEGSNYLGSFADYSDDGGVISFVWDLTDGNGNTFDSTNFSGVFSVDTSSSNLRANLQPSIQTKGGIKSAGFQKLVKKTSAKSSGIHANFGTPTPTPTNHWAIESTWTSDKFAVAFAPLNDDSTTTFKISEMMVGGAGGEDGGVVSSLSQYGLAYQLSPGNVAQSSAFEMSERTSRSNLLSYLADYNYRNFYFFGHGNPKVIAGIASDSAINAFTISQKLGNFLSSSRPENFHPYRFVMIDGCDVGKGNFCEAFGIPAQTLNNSFFITAGVRSRAFLGFKKTISFNAAQWEFRSLMLGTFFGDWQNNLPISQCVSDAQNYPTQPMDSSAVIYGATDLRKNTPNN